MLGRGRSNVLLLEVPRARVLIGQPAGADVGCYAACWATSLSSPHVDSCTPS